MVYLSDIKTHQIPVPPLDEQKFLVRQLESMATETKKLESTYQEKLKNLEELKKSILQKALTEQLHLKEVINEF